MLLAGKKYSILKESQPDNLSCPKCNSKNTTKVFVLGYYKHLFQIPFVSGGKSGKSNCEKCSVSYEINCMPDNVKLSYYELKELVKTPLWFYTGLIGIKMLVLIKIFSRYY